MMHDFAITDRHALFLDLPVTFQIGLVGRGMPYAWDDDYPARIGVMELDDPGAVRWFPIDPGYVFHVGGAHTDRRGRIVLDGCRYSPADMAVAWARHRRHRDGPGRRGRRARGGPAAPVDDRPGDRHRHRDRSGTSVRSSSPPWTTGWSGGPRGTSTRCPSRRSCTTTRPARSARTSWGRT